MRPSINDAVFKSLCHCDLFFYPPRARIAGDIQSKNTRLHDLHGAKSDASERILQSLQVSRMVARGFEIEAADAGAEVSEREMVKP